MLFIVLIEGIYYITLNDLRIAAYSGHRRNNAGCRNKENSSGLVQEMQFSEHQGQMQTEITNLTAN